MRSIAMMRGRSPKAQTCGHAPSPARRACHRAGHFGPDPLARDLSRHSGERKIKRSAPLRRAFELLDALAVIAAAALQPFQPAIRIIGFVGLVLIEAGLTAGATGLFI